MGGKFHLKLNMGERPIANKYREGKMKRTLKRELKVLEIVKREALEAIRAASLGFWLLHKESGSVWGVVGVSINFWRGRRPVSR